MPRYLNPPRAGALAAFTVALSTVVASAPAAEPAGFAASLRPTDTGALELRWPGTAGVRYRVDSSPDLLAWSARPEAPVGTGSELRLLVADPGAAAPRQFWRVAERPTGPVIPPGLVDPARLTTWNPGILADPLLGTPLGADKLPTRTTVFRTLKPGDNINAAIAACPAGQVVLLQAGTFTVSATVNLKSGVVLRGAGSQGAAAGGTTIVRTGGGTVVAIGSAYDGACYTWGSYGEPAYALVASTANGQSTIALGVNAAKFKAGDFALIDQLDDGEVAVGDGTYFKRAADRSVSQRVEIASVDTATGTITLTSPLHWAFKSGNPYLAQLVRVTAPIIKWAGVEQVLLQGGTYGSYNGQSAGGVDLSNAAYCWVRDIQTDGTNSGLHVALRGAFRCVVRDSYVHHSADYGYGKDCYGIVIGCASADCLVENNIARYMNKPIQFSNSGGGNVVAYNYADNAWSSDTGEFQECPVDQHCAYPHMELVEGNWAPKMALPETHGNAGYIAFFRNYASSQFAYPPVFGRANRQSGNVQALMLGQNTRHVTVVGNVFGPVVGADSRSAVTLTQYIGNKFANAILVFTESDAVPSLSAPSYATVWLHGNYDTVNRQTLWQSGNTQHTLPPSLYLAEQPAWWPAGTPWPWAGPDLDPMVGTLPAKARSDALH